MHVNHHLLLLFELGRLVGGAGSTKEMPKVTVGTNRIPVDAMPCSNKTQLSDAGRQQRFRWDLMSEEVKTKTKQKREKTADDRWERLKLDIAEAWQKLPRFQPCCFSRTKQRCL